MITLVRKLDTGDDSSERLDTEQEREQEQEQEKEVEARRTQQVMSINIPDICMQSILPPSTFNFTAIGGGGEFCGA